MNWTELETLGEIVDDDNASAVAILVEAANCAAGWLVEPATSAGELSLLNAALHLSRAEYLCQQDDLRSKAHVEAPDESTSLVDLCRHLDAVVVAARDRLIDARDDSPPEGVVVASKAAMLLDAAHRDIAEVLR